MRNVTVIDSASDGKIFYFLFAVVLRLFVNKMKMQIDRFFCKVIKKEETRNDLDLRLEFRAVPSIHKNFSEVFIHYLEKGSVVLANNIF